MRRTTVKDIAKMKADGQKIPIVTAYDYTSACIADGAGIPVLLVGDSLGMVVLGYDSTLQVTMEDMVHHMIAVSRGAKRALIVGDLPFLSYQVSSEQALRNAGRFLQEGYAHAVKLEGGERVAGAVHRIVESGIPVMGHIGLTPQSVNEFGGYRVQGKGKEEAEALIKDALALQDAGAFSVVLELVPAPLSQEITRRLSIPTIGIGAGPYCDGQIQVFHDILGLYTDFVPKHTRRFAQIAAVMADGLTSYIAQVQDGSFPSSKESFSMDEATLKQLEPR